MHSTSDINSSFRNSLNDLKKDGQPYHTRGTDVIEITGYNFAITNPRMRFLTQPYRYNNISATIAETFWVFSGRNDLNFLKFFLPNCVDYADPNTPFLWGGAYGPRLRVYDVLNNRFFLYDENWNAPSKNYEISQLDKKNTDQILNAIKAIKQDKFTRQSIIMIPDPTWDYDPDFKTKDRPCTIFIQFLVRDNRLNCYTYLRSNDVIWGAYNINIFEWTFLQEIIASILGLKLGTYNHYATSFHYYTTMEKRIGDILSHNYNVYYETNKPNIMNRFDSLEDFYHTIEKAIAVFEKLIAFTDPTSLLEQSLTEIITNNIPESYHVLNSPLRDYFISVSSYILIEHGLYKAALTLLEYILEDDIYIATIEGLMRRSEKKGIRNEIESLFNNSLSSLKQHRAITDNTYKYITGDWKTL